MECQQGFERCSVVLTPVFAGKVQGHGYPTRRIDETAIAGLSQKLQSKDWKDNLKTKT